MNTIYYAESSSQFSTTAASVYVLRQGETVSLVVRDKDGNAYPVVLKSIVQPLADLFEKIGGIEDADELPFQVGTMIGSPDDDKFLVFIESFSHKGLVRDETSSSPLAVKADPVYTTRLRIAVVVNAGNHKFSALFPRQYATQIAAELRGK